MGNKYTTHTRDCPTECGRIARAGHLMCPDCWEATPAQLRRNVLRTWSRFSISFDYDSRRAYQRAQNAAIAAVKESRS